MSGIVSYDLFVERIGSGAIGFTPEGGIYGSFINNTGTSLKGTVVAISSSLPNAVDIAPAGSVTPVGVIYESGIPNGSPVKIVIYGKAEVLLENSQASSLGYWCGVSTTQAGRMIQLSTVPITEQLNNRIGYSLQSVSGGTDVLSLVQLHFA